MAPPPLMKLVLQFSDGSEISSSAMPLNSCLRRFCYCADCGIEQPQGSCSVNFFASEVVNFMNAELETIKASSPQPPVILQTDPGPRTSVSSCDFSSNCPRSSESSTTEETVLSDSSLNPDQPHSSGELPPSPSQPEEHTISVEAPIPIPAETPQPSRSDSLRSSFFYGPQRFSIVTSCSDFDLNRRRTYMQSSFVKSTTSFSCGHCDKAFVRRGNLQIHLRIHLGVYPFRCGEDRCRSKFISRQGLLAHIRSRHSGVSASHGTIVGHASSTRSPFWRTMVAKKATAANHRSKSLESTPGSRTSNAETGCTDQLFFPVTTNPGNAHDQLTAVSVIAESTVTQSDSDLKPFICEICPKSFMYEENLRYHEQFIHPKFRRPMTRLQTRRAMIID